MLSLNIRHLSPSNVMPSQKNKDLNVILVEFTKEISNTFCFIAVLLMKAKVPSKLHTHYSYRLISSYHWIMNNDLCIFLKI